MVTCSRAEPFEVRGQCYQVTVLRVGSDWRSMCQVIELSFGGKEFRDAVPLYAGAQVTVPRGATAFWVRGGVNPALGDAEETDVELLLSVAPLVAVSPPPVVELPARVVTAGSVAMPLVSGNVLAEAPLTTRGPVRVSCDVLYEYVGGGPNIPVRTEIALESGGSVAASVCLVGAPPDVVSTHLDSVRPVHASWDGQFNSSWVRVLGSRPGAVGSVRASLVVLTVQPCPQGATPVAAI